MAGSRMWISAKSYEPLAPDAGSDGPFLSPGSTVRVERRDRKRFSALVPGLVGSLGPMPDRGNVLFITVDQWRGDCLSAVGHPVVRTPNLDRLAASGALVHQPLGPGRAVRAEPGLPLHRHLPEPEPLGAQRHPARQPPHQRGARDPGRRPRPGAVRLHRLEHRPPHRAGRRSAAAHLRGCAAGDAGGARLPVRAAHPLDRPPLRPRLPRAEAGPRHLPGRPVVPGRGRPPADVGPADLPGRAQRDGLPHRRAAGLAGRCRDDDQPGRRAPGPGRAVVRPPELPATAPALPGGRPVPRPVRPGRRAVPRPGPDPRAGRVAAPTGRAGRGRRRRPGGRGRDAPDPGHLLRADQRGRPPPRAGARLARLHRAGRPTPSWC